MALFPVILDENKRCRLGLILTFTNSLMVLLGCGMIGAGLFTKSQIETYLDLLKGYNGASLPYMHVSVGVLLVVLHALAGKMCFDCGYFRTRERWQSLMLILMLILFVISWVILAAACVSFGHKSYLDHSFGEGIMTGMEQYKADHDVKVRVDMLQMQYQCCGSNGYRDWLKVSWINMKFENKSNLPEKSRIEHGEVIEDSVPFSCCDVRATRPCVHNEVSSSKHQGYDPSEPTLYRTGCVGPLMSYMEQAVIMPTATLALIAMFLEYVIIVMIRYLQTSMDNSRRRGKPRGLGRAYILEHLPCSCMEELTPLPDEAEVEAQQQLTEPLVPKEASNQDDVTIAPPKSIPDVVPSSNQSFKELPKNQLDGASNLQLPQSPVSSFYSRSHSVLSNEYKSPRHSQQGSKSQLSLHHHPHDEHAKRHSYMQPSRHHSNIPLSANPSQQLSSPHHPRIQPSYNQPPMQPTHPQPQPHTQPLHHQPPVQPPNHPLQPPHQPPMQPPHHQPPIQPPYHQPQMQPHPTQQQMQSFSRLPPPMQPHHPQPFPQAPPMQEPPSFGEAQGMMQGFGGGKGGYGGVEDMNHGGAKQKESKKDKKKDKKNKKDKKDGKKDKKKDKKSKDKDKSKDKKKKGKDKKDKKKKDGKSKKKTKDSSKSKKSKGKSGKTKKAGKKRKPKKPNMAKKGIKKRKFKARKPKVKKPKMKKPKMKKPKMKKPKMRKPKMSKAKRGGGGRKRRR